jgi:hypothetical protein
MKCSERVYLSVDLDYFVTVDSAKDFVEQVLALEVPTAFVVMHQHLVKHVNAFKPTILVNVDYHDDCAIHKSRCPTDANWVNMIDSDIRSNGLYKWITPDACGCCVNNETGYEEQWLDRVIPWKRFKYLIRTSDLSIRSIAKPKEVVACGIVLSPDYTDDTIIKWARRKKFGWLRRYARAEVAA